MKIHYLDYSHNDVLAISLLSSLARWKVDIFEHFNFKKFDVFDTYLHVLNLNTWENFIIAYELLDEMCDWGWLSSDIKMLKSITQTNREILKSVEKREKDN